MKPAAAILDNLLWEPAGAQTIAEAIAGSTITGAEPIDYPLTDGLIIYLIGKSGRQLALEIGADPDTDPTEGNPFYINFAEIPQIQEAQRL